MIVQEEYILRLASEGKRISKRRMDEYRKMEIEKNPIHNAEGSARVRMGKTEVIVGVKMDIMKPFPDKPDEGVLMTEAEFSPMASELFEEGPPRENAIELARVIDRGIRESGAIDTKKLCIEKGEKVWAVHIDISMLNHDGNLLDAAGMGAVVALQNAKMPEYDGETVDYEKKKKSLPVLCKPIPVTIVKIGDKLLVDADIDEEGVMEGRITMTTKDDGNMCAIQKSGSDSFSLEEIEKVVELAVSKSKELRKLV